MNTYYTLLESLRRIFESDDKVHTVLTGDTSEVDNYRKNIFPLVHILVTDSPYVGDNTAVVRYTVEITVVDIRDINKEDVLDKFWTNDNRHDNWNTTRAILKLAQDKLIKDILENDVTLVTSSSAIPENYSRENLLDGWQQTWTIDVPDLLTDVCLDEPIG